MLASLRQLLNYFLKTWLSTLVFPTLWVTGTLDLLEGSGQLCSIWWAQSSSFSLLPFLIRWSDTEGECSVRGLFETLYVCEQVRLGWVVGRCLILLQFAYIVWDGYEPFWTSMWQQSITPHEVIVQKMGGKCPAAYRFVRSKHQLLDQTNDSLAKIQHRMTKYADMQRRHVELSFEDHVCWSLPADFEENQPQVCASWSDSKIGSPLEVLNKVGSLAYRLKLHDRFKIHPTFYVSFLKKFHEVLVDMARQQTQRARND